MTHITKNDVNELWNQAPHNWHGLHQAADQRKGKAEGISNQAVVEVAKISQQMESSGQNFPDSPDKLYQLLNEKMGDHTDQ